MKNINVNRADAPHEVQENLKIFSDIMRACDVPFWLEAGTALAAHRDGKIFPWEHDVDVATWIEHKDGVLRAVDQMRAHGWRVKIQKGFPYLDNIIQITLPALPDGREPFPNQYDIYLYRRVGDKAMMRWIHQPIGRFAGLQKKSIWYAKALALPRGKYARMIQWMPHCFRRALFSFTLRCFIRFGWCTYHVHPLRFFEELRTIDFYGVPVQIPADTDAFLEHRYGPGWKHPDPQFNQSGKWKKSDARPAKPLHILGMPTIDYTLQDASIDRTTHVQRLMQHGVRIAHPSQFLSQYIRVSGDTMTIGDRVYSLEHGVKFISFGKAGRSMAEAFVSLVGEKHIRGGIVSAPRLLHTQLAQISGITCIEGTHPFVSDRSQEAGSAALAFADTCTADDVVVCLVSGGGSALLAQPVPGVALQEKVDFLRNCMRHGVAERELNIVRKGLSEVKGGKLAARLAPARIVNLVLSDERQHQIEANASGPTVPNNASITAQAVLDGAGLWSDTSSHIRAILTDARSLTADDLAHVDIHTVLVRGRDVAMDAMKKEAGKSFDSVNVMRDFFHETTHGRVEAVAKELGERYRAYAGAASSGRHLVIAYGEVLVPSKQESRGGRCQHLASLMIDELRTIPSFTFAALASDGCDFLHGVHGAIITDAVIRRIDEMGIDYQEAIATTQTYALHEQLGTLVRGEYTGTNVNDFYFFSFEKGYGL